VKFVPVEWSVEGWKRAAELVFREKPAYIYLQAPDKFQDLINRFIRGLIPWERFLDQIAKRTGTPSPEIDPKTAWVHVVKMARNTTTPLIAVEPDLDKVLKSVEKKLTVKDKKKTLHEARLWYLGREGFLKRLISFFDFPVRLLRLPPELRTMWIGFWMNVYGVIVNVIPGDQRDFVAAVALADTEIARIIAQRLSKLEDGHAFIDRWYCDRTRDAFLEHER